MTKIELVAEIKTKVASHPQWAERALVVLFDRQTVDEQVSEVTRHLNQRGFSAFDAEILSSFAKQVNAGRRLTAKQLEIAYKRLPKYAKQLTTIAQAKQAQAA